MVRTIKTRSMINDQTKCEPVVAEVVGMEVLNAQDVFVGSRVHRSTVCRLQQE